MVSGSQASLTPASVRQTPPTPAPAPPPALAADAPQGSSGAAVAAGDTIHCYGITSCKGQNDCKTTEHACKGNAECAGHGFKATTAKECLDKDGTIGDIAA